MKFRLGVILVVFTLAACGDPSMSGSAPQGPKDHHVVIGTGGVTGVYYPVGGAICKLVNHERAQHQVRCSVESTDGSVYNLKALRAGELDAAVVQSDTQAQAVEGTGKFAEAGADGGLRALFSVHPEPFTVLARADVGVITFADLKGKRVNVGNPGSGQRVVVTALLDALGWNLEDFALASELRTDEQAAALCDNKVDAIFFVARHPNASIAEAANTCDTVLVSVTGVGVDKLLANTPHYRAAVIPGGTYRGNPRDVPTFGVSATVVAEASLSAETAYVMVKAVFANLDEFKSLHPAFATLSKEDMARESLFAPLHEGAARYFQEIGLRP